MTVVSCKLSIPYSLLTPNPPIPLQAFAIHLYSITLIHLELARCDVYSFCLSEAISESSGWYKARVETKNLEKLLNRRWFKSSSTKKCRKIVYCQVCGKGVVCYFKYPLYHGAAVCILLCHMYEKSRNVSYRILVQILFILDEGKNYKTYTSQER